MIVQAFADVVGHDTALLGRLQIAEERVSPQIRAERIGQLWRVFLAGTIRSLYEWADFSTFHAIGVEDALFLKRLLDWIGAHPDVRTQVEAEDVFVIGHDVTEDERRENESVGELRRFIRLSDPVQRALLHHRVANVNRPGGGFAAGTDRHG